MTSSVQQPSSSNGSGPGLPPPVPYDVPPIACACADTGSQLPDRDRATPHQDIYRHLRAGRIP